ncbi:hypothetical protein COL26b_007768 [Colletotrichum chrysophilum]|uniref:uncharacterized protein n=1 Tax=Colletotrichum chrysophilum TaxID=1836956 RepID=UPI0023011D52|nr:uncharacterized protein COL26b_007768 [Colletotrichum chrysophilum]KAJ0374056.1 hypothetical protein COL26b_007768 [Colletotrichum chrysophilum]
MAKKKTKQPVSDDVDGGVPSGSASQSSSNGSSRGRNASSAVADNVPALIICRNKHWRFISSFHGPWLQMPIEILETIANINYNTPRPRPIDPAVFFDLLKIRRLVDEATTLAVRAASDIASPTLANLHGGLNSHTALGYGGHGAKLSRERKFRMREQASQKLARAYRLDEIACSVATMQGASTLEEIGSLVLQRSKEDPDAKYVHFFHEKIPSRQLAECTSLQPLDDIISARPTEGEALRTRATVRIFKDDYEGAAQDLSSALQVHRFHQPLHRPPSSQDLQLATGSRRPPDVILTEEQQPSSLEIQLLFQRAGVYLTMACQHVVDGLPEAAASPRTGSSKEASRDASPGGEGPPDQPPEPTAAEKEAGRQRLEKRKIVKTYAKRALRDYLAYLSKFEYTPDLPLRVTREFTEKVNLAAHGIRHPRVPDSGPAPSYKTYPLSDLFAAVPPADIPPYPSQELNKIQSSPKAAALAAASITKDSNTLAHIGENEEQRKERIRQQAIMDSLDDDRVVDEASLRAAITARQKRAQEDHDYLQGIKNGFNGKQDTGLAGQPSPALRRWSVDDGREYPILTERAAAIARWVLEAPTVSLGTAKRKKKSGPKKDKAQNGSEAATNGMANLAISEAGRAVDAQA